MATVVLASAVAANVPETDVVACWLEVAVAVGNPAASRIYGCLAYMLVAFEGVLQLEADREADMKPVRVSHAEVAVASARVGCRKVDSVCRHSLAAVHGLGPLGWSSFGECAAALGVVRFERADATCLVGEVTARAGIVASLHCALEAIPKAFLDEHVESRDDVPFVGASWGVQVPVSLAPLRPYRRLPPHHHHRRLLHAYPRNPEALCVRARRHTISH